VCVCVCVCVCLSNALKYQGTAYAASNTILLSRGLEQSRKTSLSDHSNDVNGVTMATQERDKLHSHNADRNTATYTSPRNTGAELSPNHSDLR
jgi:hypothetical protein